MKRRQWSSNEKLKIVLEGLSGQIKIKGTVPALGTG